MLSERVCARSSKYGGAITPAVARLWDRFYPDHDERAFENLVAATARPDWHVLEIGAGSGRCVQRYFDLRERVARYVGIDLDERVLDNPNLHEARVADAQNLPFPDETFDFVFHLMVAEHLQDPEKALFEMARILKSGGLMMFATPSKWYYSTLIARLTPHWFHTFYVSRLGSRRQSEDTFPTVYKMNDIKAVKAACRNAGLKVTIEFRHFPPGYLRFHSFAFLIGVAYERTIERLWPPLAAQMIVRAHKL